MILSTFFDNVNAAFRGSDDNAPTSGEDYDLWLLTTNRKLHEYARDGKALRSSLFQTVSVGTVSAGNQTYELDTQFLLPASTVKVKQTNGNYVDLTIIEPQERGEFSGAVYFTGNDPQSLTFTDTLSTDHALIGGTIEVDGYFLPDDLTSPNQTIPVDDPYWLVYAVASELAFNDESYDAKAGDLNNKANNLYTMMNSNNRRGSHNNPRTVRTKVGRIINTSSEGRIN